MFKARKRFGQHFLHDQNIIHQIIEAVTPRSHDNIVEIGPGKGALTFLLLGLLKNIDFKFSAIELDRDLFASLKRSTSQYKNFKLIQADALDFNFADLIENTHKKTGGLKIVGNLPYNISTPLLFHLLEFKSCISEMVFMLQKEVVDRICAEPNTPDYGRLSVMLQHDFDVESLFDVPNTAFIPPPKVESAVVRLIPKDVTRQFDYKVFSDIVREAFQHRRKTLRHALSKFFTESQLEALGISSKRRAGELSVQDFEKLAREWKHV